MTIRKGEPWGTPLTAPAGLFLAADDAAAGRFVTEHRRRGEPVPPFGVTAGDLARTMGGGTPGRFPGTVLVAPVDALRAELDGRVVWAVAHVVAGVWWRGDVRVAMNAQFRGALDLAPRSHPDDGRLDELLVDPAMPSRARWQARRRARSGTHLPHPQLAVRQAGAVVWEFARPVAVRVDGVRAGRARRVAVTVEPDALTVHA